MSSIIKDLAKELKESLPFGIVNSNPKNSLAKELSYKSVEEAKSFGYDNIISDTSMLTLDASGITIPTTISTAINAHQIIIYDLDNPNHVWDWNEARKIIKNTSWYQELGEPPIHGMFILSADKTKIHWVNRENKTLDIYMTFDASTTNSIHWGSAGGPPYIVEGIYVLDLTLYSCFNGGFPVVDFLLDQATSRNSSSIYMYEGNISQRNTGGGHRPFANQPVPTAANGSSVIAWRDYDRVDNFGRPLHYWAVNTAVGGAVPGPVWIYKPSNDTSEIVGQSADKGYQGGGLGATLTSDNTGKLAISKSGIYYNSFNASSNIGLTGGHIKARYVNEFGNEIGYFSSTIGREWWERPISLTSLNALAAYSNHKYEYQLSGWNEGMVVTKNKRDIPGSGSYTQSQYADQYRILTNSTYTSPLLVGSRYAAYPLNNGNDISGAGRNLSTLIGGGPTFSSTGGPLGPKASFDGTTALGISPAAAFSGGSTLSVSFYVKLSNVAGGQEMVTKWSDHLFHRCFTCACDISGGYVNFGFSLWNGSINSTLETGHVFPYDPNKWYHFVGTWKGGSFMRLYIDGVLMDDNPSNSPPSTLQNNGSTILRIGAATASDATTLTRFFYGDIANVMVSENSMTEEQIQLEYMRMKMGLAGYSFTLAADDIDSIKVDEESGLAIVCTGNVAHIMDIETGAILETKAISQGTLNDADITTVNGSDKYQYVLAGSDTIEQFGSEVKL